MSSKPFTDKEGKVRPLTKVDFASVRPLSEVAPDVVEYLQARQRGQRGPQKAPTKLHTALRLDVDILEAYKATGAGWQTRMNQVLRNGLDKISL